MPCSIYNNSDNYNNMLQHLGNAADANFYMLITESNDFKTWLKNNDLQVTGINDLVEKAKIYNAEKEGVLFKDLNATVSSAPTKTGLFNNNPLKEKHALDIVTSTILEYEHLYIKKKIVAKDSAGKPNAHASMKTIILTRLAKHLATKGLRQDQIDFVKELSDNIKEGNSSLYNLAVNSPTIRELSKTVGGTYGNVDTTTFFTTIDQSLENDIEVSEDEDGFYKEWGDTDKSALTMTNKVKREINLLPKLLDDSKSYTEDGRVIYNKDNSSFSGLANNISARDVSNLLLYKADYSSADNFVKSLNDIASKYSGSAKSLIVLADKLSKDPSLKNSFFSTFNKVVINRTQQRFEYTPDGVNNSVVKSNIFSDPSYKLYDNLVRFVHSAEANGLRANYLFNNLLDKLNYNYDSNLNFSKGDPKATDEMVDLLHDLFVGGLNVPISKDSLKLYLTKEGVHPNMAADRLNDIASLLKSLDAMIVNKNSAKTLFYKEQYKQQKAAEEAGETFTTKRFEFKPDQKFNINLANVIRISKELGKNEISNVESNSTNVEGKVVSDVINPSYLSSYYDLWKQPDQLESYLIDIVTKTSWGKYSNGILEVTNDKGDVVIPGLLKQVTTSEGVQYILTDYYDQFGYTILDGVKNTVTDARSRYSGLSKRDWNIQSVTSFINNSGFDSNISINGTSYRKARYNITTPSDAPKSYFVESVVIPTDNLFNNDGSINRNNRMYRAILNIAKQEMSRMVKNASTIFEIDDNGLLKTNDKGEPILKKDKKDLYKFYHYNGKNVFEVVDGKIQLTGNVFKFTALDTDRKKLKNSDIFPVTGLPTIKYDKNGEPSMFLTNDEATALLEHIDSYIREMCDDSFYEMMKIKQFIPNNYPAFPTYNKKEFKTYDDYKKAKRNYEENAKANQLKKLSAEYVLNYIVQYNEQMNIFNGRPDFYKNQGDTIKRNKQMIAGGAYNAAFRIANLNDSNESIGEININGRTIPVKERFNFATIVDPAKPSNNIEAIRKGLVEGGANEQSINDIISRFQRNTDVADAQTYITLDELAKRLYLQGKLEDYQELINRLDDESVELTDADMKAFTNMIQVQKNFYFDMELDTEFGDVIPNQIKNAEFVLIPRFIKNTGLELLNNAMKKNGIDQMNMESTEKATRRRMVPVYDADGNITESSIKEFADNGSSYIRDAKYARLYLQQDTPQHLEDATNKAGVQIMKKIKDNTPLKYKHLVDKLDRLFTTNIKSSFTELLEEIGYDDTTGKVDYEKLLSAVSRELIDRGGDEDMVSFTKTDANGSPLMPVSFPMIKTKAEQVINAKFTNKVTNQKLPGFHSAQVSNAGMNRLDFADGQMTESEYRAKYGNNMRRLNYMASDKNGYDGVVECLMPHWAKNFFSKDGTATIEELEAAGLNSMLGYRIPTEGKQSIVILKVVGFLSPAQGSTIILPDEFVTQTGADFDIDSVYGIYSSSYRNKKGELKKVQYLNHKEAYIKYVAKNTLGNKSAIAGLFEDSKDLKTAITEAKLAIKLNTFVFSSLSNPVKKVIKDNHEAVNISEMSYEDAAAYNYQLFTAIAENEQVGDKDRELLRAAIDKETYKLNKQEYYKRLGVVYEELKEASTIDAQYEDAIKVARDNSLKMPQELTEEELNTTAARNNEILDTMIELLKIPESFVESKSGSNFDIMSAAKDKVEKLLAKAGGGEKVSTNIFSPYGQSEYRNRATSGLSLKGISVAWDGLTSILSVAKAESAVGFTYLYDKTKYTKEALESVGHVVEHDHHYEVTFNKLGWSDNGNKNIDGFLITAYSSQTTANILDNVKDPVIDNLGELFGEFKILPTLGLSFETASLLIRQPVVDAIADRIRNNNSIYDKSGFDPYIAVELDYLKQIHVLMHPEAKEVPKTKVALINSMRDLLSQVYDDENNRIVRPLSNEELEENLRLSNVANDAQTLVEQLDVLNNMIVLRTIADNVGKYQKVLNTDKVGASKGFVESDKMLQTIESLRALEVLKSGDKNLIDAIYPPYNNGADPFGLQAPIMESVYPPLYAQLLYSTKSALDINTKIFDTYTPGMMHLKSLFMFNNADTINKLEDYSTSYLLSETNYVKQNTYDNITVDDDYKSRIYGIVDYIADFDFKDLSNDNISKFMSLSPANKVQLLQKYMSNEDTLLQYINYSTSRNGEQNIRIITDMNGYDKYKELFSNMFNNYNPFVKITAMDMIRYAVVKEGFKYRQGNISNVIPFNLLYNEYGVDGVGLISEYRNNLQNLNNLTESDLNNHPIAKNFNRQFIDQTSTKTFENRVIKGESTIKFNNDDTAILSNEAASKLGIVSGTTINPRTKFIITNKPNSKEFERYEVFIPDAKVTSELLKDSKPVVNYGIYLIPVNKLEANEYSLRSIIESNNKYAPSDVLKSKYAKLVDSSYIDKLDVKDYVTEAATKDFAVPVYYNTPADFANLDFDKIGNIRTVRATNPDLANIVLEAKNNNTKLVIVSTEAEHIIDSTLIPLNNNNVMVLIPTAGDKAVSKIHITKVIKALNKLNKHVKRSNYLLANPSDVDVTSRLNVHQILAIQQAFSKLPMSSGNANGTVRTLLARGIFNELDLQKNEYVKISLEGKEFRLELNDANVKAPLIETINSRGSAVLVSSNYLSPFNNDDIMYSAIEDSVAKVDDALHVVAANFYNKANRTGDKTYRDSVNTLKQLGFNTDITSRTSIDINNRLASLIAIKDTVKLSKERLMRDVNMFTENPSTGSLVDILDDSLYNTLKHDNGTTIRFFNIIHEVKTFSDDYDALTKVNLHFDETGLTDDEKLTISNIRAVISEIEAFNDEIAKLVNKADTAYAKYITKVLSQYSTNPAIIDNPELLLEAITDEGWIANMAESIYEQKTPIIQVAIKMLDNRLSKTTIDADTRQSEFDAKLAEYEAKGLNINDVIKDGYFITPMTEEFLDIDRQLRNNVSNTRKAFGVESQEYSDAMLARKKFLKDNVEQEYDIEVYNAEIDAIEILNSNEAARRKIKELNTKMANIINNAINGDYSTLSDDQIKELTDLRNAKRRLGSKYDENGNLKIGEDLFIAETIKKYNDAISKNKKKYYTSQPTPEFINTLNSKLSDISSYPSHTKEYKDAERWIRLNTRLEFNEATQSRLSELYDILGNKQGKLSRSQLRSLADRFLDFNGVVDATKMSEKDIANSKRMQEEAYGDVKAPKLIKAKIDGAPVMTDSFYDNLTNVSNGVNIRKIQVTKSINKILSRYLDHSTGELDLGGITPEDNAELAYWYNMLDNTNISFDGKKVVESRKTKSKLSKGDIQFLDQIVTEYDMAKFNADEALVRARGVNAVEEWKRSATVRQQSKEAKQALRDYYYKNTKNNTTSKLEKAIKTKTSISDSHGNLVKDFLATKQEVMEATDILVDRTFTIKDVDGNKLYNLESLDSLKELVFEGSFGTKTLVFNDTESKAVQIKKFFTENTILNRPKDILGDIDNNDSLEVRVIDAAKNVTDNKFLTIDRNGDLVPIGSLREVVAKDTTVVPNPMIYGYMTSSNDVYIDTKKTDATKELNTIVKTKPTVYYNRVKSDLDKKLRDGDITRDEYNKWMEDNHVYNPYNQRYEPLQVWQERKATSSKAEEYVPKPEWIKEDIKPEYKNNNFTERQLTIKSNSKYYNEDYRAIENNADKKDFYDYLRNTVNQYVTDPRDKFLANKGLVPVLKEGSKEDNYSALERIKKAFAINDMQPETDYTNLDNKKINLQMLYEAASKKFIKPEPRDRFASNEDYYEHLKIVNAENDKVRQENEEFRKSVTSKDYAKSIRTFIKHGVDYENKVYGNAFLKAFKGYLKDANYMIQGGASQNLIDRTLSKVKGEEVFATGKKSNALLLNKVESYHRRYAFDMFERKSKMLKYSKTLMTINSLQTMALNFDGGVSNILFGAGGIFSEANANQYFNKSDVANGTKEYFTPSVINDVITNYGRDKADTIQGALFKLFDVVETQVDLSDKVEKTGVGRYGTSDMLFINQSAGEHMMQNATLIALLNSHRMVEGNVMSRLDYVNDKLAESFMTMAGTAIADEFTTFANNVKYNGNIANGFDLVKSFLKTLPVDQAKAFINELDIKRSEIEDAFDSYESVASQFELINGKAVIKADSDLLESEVGQLRSKMMGVNRKIHGVYDKIGANQAQEYWWGQLLFQYKKHVVPALTKRYKNEYYNEVRETWEKGYYRSAWSFLSSPAREAISKLKTTNPLANALDTTFAIFSAYISFVANIRTNYKLASDLDQSNLKRTVNDLGMLLLAAAIGIALPELIFDDEEEKKKSTLGAHLIYWGDRLSDETHAYSPYGITGEFKNIYKSPVATQRTVEAPFELLDIILSEIGAIGSDPKEYKKTMYKNRGAYKDKHKFEVWLRRNIPLYRQINKFETKTDNLNYVRTSYK